MPEPRRRFRIVGEGAPPPRRHRGPGIAVLLVGTYAVLFGAGLFLLWRASARGVSSTRPASSPPHLPASGGARSGAALLAGEGLAPEERAGYQERIAHDCCDCGCDMTVAECLASDQKCPRSREIARKLLAERAP
ncbi:MAG TPA: hypothetical protein VIA45_06095 [Thermoanaerobaculia bacterium]|jgi:hypothetical protein